MGIKATGNANSMLHFFQHPEEMMEEMCIASADSCRQMIKGGFRNETDPYGNHWAPWKHYYGPWRILNKTGSMMDSWKVTVAMSGYKFKFEFDNSKAYAKYHQTGTRYMAQRRMVPTEGGRLDASWQIALDKATLAVMRKYVAASGGR